MEQVIDLVDRYIDEQPQMGLGKYLCVRLSVCNPHIARMNDIEVMQYLNEGNTL